MDIKLKKLFQYLWCKLKVWEFFLVDFLIFQSITTARDFVSWVKKEIQRYKNENATSEIISTHCFFQTHTFQNAPTLINGPRSRKKVRLISRNCIVCSYSGKHSTNRYTMVNRICFPAHMLTWGVSRSHSPRSRTFFHSPIPRGIYFIFLDLRGMLNCPFLIPRGVKFSEELPFTFWAVFLDKIPVLFVIRF